VTSTAVAKQAVRERVWMDLEHAGVVDPGVRGYIPTFAGAQEAATRLASLPVWQQAQVLKVVPDRAQLPVRVLALEQGKLVYMAAPRLATPQPFYVLDPQALTAPAVQAAEPEVAASSAPKVGTADMRPVDLIVVGSVAVNAHGARLGKGAGYSDIEMALLTEAGLLTDRTIIATTVHEIQVLNEAIPEAAHDFRVDLIATPERLIWCDEPRRPRVDWGFLRPEQVAAIPALQRLNDPP
jgi:5-formyltetrahydrofolate cyclo-ligase